MPGEIPVGRDFILSLKESSSVSSSLALPFFEKERRTAVASLPKGGDGYEEVHRIRFAFPSTFDSIYDKSKLTAHTSKCSG